MSKRTGGTSIEVLRQQLESKHLALEVLLRLLRNGATSSPETVITAQPPVSRKARVRPPRPNSHGTLSAPWWPALPLPATPMSIRPGFAHLTLEAGQPITTAVPVFGLDSAAVERAVALISQRQRRDRYFVPLFLTDSPEQAVFRRAGYLAEYFPRAIYGSEEDPTLFRERFLLLWRKWNFQMMIDLSAPGFLARRFQEEELPQQRLPARQGFNPTKPAPRLPRPQTPDIAALKAEYFSKGLDREPDTFVLYRIIGNDLYPRHRRGQAAENVRFILENEPALAGCEKRWIVNRIIDPEQEAAILNLLEQYRQPYIRITFDLEEYSRVEWDLESFPGQGFFLRGSFELMHDYDKSRAEAHARRQKNNYVMNNNGARNAALRDGRGRAKWVLPWDGNCFLTEQAWAEIAATVAEQPWMKYFVVPMARVGDNNSILDRSFAPDASEEPQILFRMDAQEEFDERFPYGRRPKVELLWRLGVSGNWDGWIDDVWDLPRPARADEAGAFGRAGWVARLASGQDELENASRAGLIGRGVARNAAIITVLDRLDEEAIRRCFDSSALSAYDENLVADLRSAADGSVQAHVARRLIREAELALRQGPYSVVHKTTLAPSGDPHDYWHPAPYCWPNPDTVDGLPYVFRDGQRAPGTRLYEAESDKYDRTRLQQLFDSTTVLALAWQISGKLTYADHAAELVRHWFLVPQTRMNPHLRYAQVQPGRDDNEGQRTGIIEMKDIYYFLDAVRLLERANVLHEDERSEFREWLKEYLDWLRTSPQGGEERKANNNHGTCYDLQVGAIAAFLDDVPLLSSTFRTSRERLLEQFDAKGRQPRELARTLTAHYCCFNLQSWVNLATLAACCGVDLWSFTGADGRGLRCGLEWLLSHIEKPEWPHRQIEPFDRDRFLPLYYAYRSRFGALGARDVPPPYGINPLYFPHDGIKPFWMLGEPLKCPHVRARVETAHKSCFLAAAGREAVAPPNAGVVEKKLWAGFSQRALEDLEKIKGCQAASPRNASTAAWALARWYAVERQYERALENASLVREIDGTREADLGRVLLEADCLVRLGHGADGRKLISSLLQRKADEFSLYLSMANTYVGHDFQAPCDDDIRLAWISRAYEKRGLLPVVKANAALPLSLSNLVANADRQRAGSVKDGPKVTVIMPAYNAAGSVMFALESVRNQTWADLEILVVDDASVDSTRELVTEAARRDSRVRLISLAENGGPYIARNTALRVASGKYVTVHDADDWSHPQMIAFQVGVLEAGGHVATISHWARCSPDLYFSHWRPEKTLLSLNYSSLMMETCLFGELGGWDPVRFGADNELLWRLRRRYGASSVYEVEKDTAFAFSGVSGESLTSTERSHVRTAYYGMRKDYREAYVRWHHRAALSADFRLAPDPDAGRRFPAPEGMLVSYRGRILADHVFVGDFSNGASLLHNTMSEIMGEISVGKRIAIFHWPSYASPPGADLDYRVAELVDKFAVQQISAFEAVDTERVTLCDPRLLEHVLDGVPQFGAPRLDVLGWTEDVRGAKARLEKLFGAGIIRSVRTASEIA